MIGKDCGQLRPVFRLQQIFHSARRQLGECFVGWGKYRERTCSLERVHKPGGLDGCDECGECAGGCGGINDILRHLVVFRERSRHRECHHGGAEQCVNSLHT